MLPEQIQKFATFISGNARLPPPSPPRHKMYLTWYGFSDDNATFIIRAHTCFSSIDVCYERYLPPLEVDMYDEIVMLVIPTVGFQMN